MQSQAYVDIVLLLAGTTAVAAPTSSGVDPAGTHPSYFGSTPGLRLSRERRYTDRRCSGTRVLYGHQIARATVTIQPRQILSDTANRQLFNKRSSFSQPVHGAGYEDLVAAQSRAVADHAREIADALNHLQRQTRAQ